MLQKQLNKSLKYSNKLKIGNTKINWTKSVKYLEVTIDDKLYFEKHVKQIIKKAKAARKPLFHILNGLIAISITR